MDFGKYEKYMNDRKAVTVENNRRIEKKFAECEKWVADNLINCGCVFTNHSELLQKQSFMIWIDNGISISHKIYKLSECGITPLVKRYLVMSMQFGSTSAAHNGLMVHPVSIPLGIPAA